MHDRISTHDNSQLVWRDGVILTDGNAQAKVIETYHKKEIAICIWGNQKRSLLEAIRRELWKIHSSYNSPTDPPDQHRLKYKELIPCNCPNCKNSPAPHLYPLDALRRRLDNRRYEVECEAHCVMVNVRGLVDDFPDYSREWEGDLEAGILSKTGRVEATVHPSFNPTIIIQQTQENKPMSTTVNQNHSGSGDNVAGDKIVNNNVNTAELLLLIIAMRQTAMQFPPEIQESVIMDIEDVEAELKKPEGDRNLTRLKKRLIALATAGSLIAAPIAGMADFANNAIDLGIKLGIEMPVFPTP
jgi:internalin A